MPDLSSRRTTRRVQLIAAAGALACLVLGVVTSGSVFAVGTFVLLVISVAVGPVVESRRRRDDEQEQP